jgi:Zn-dependent protease with chaperone function
MSELYPAGPANVPANLTAPTRSYKRKTYIAVAAILGFVSLFMGLAFWFLFNAYRHFSSLGHTTNAFLAVVSGSVSLLLGALLLSAIVRPFKRDHNTDTFEVTARDQPRLFAFLHRVADEAGAPRPNRVFLSHRVNAAVFYDLSILNLLIPSKKNLEIGLGLANVLTLGEMKAVLAHEFGHFAQRSMAIGRWVYTAQQIASYIVHKRGRLDSALRWISVQDPRLAWIGWIMRLIVWSLRSLLDTAFSWVVLAERALSREMELQADLIAVSLSGSDSLIHALHRLGAADDALEAALDAMGSEHGHGRLVTDVFAMQERALGRLREVLADPAYGKTPALASTPAAHRLFKAGLAEPPRMWSSHPTNDVREENAKRHYVPAPLDDRSAWLLFDEPEVLRLKLTQQIYGKDYDEAKVVPLEKTFEEIDRRFGKTYLAGDYRGVYRDRAVTRFADNPEAFFAENTEASREALDALYPESLNANMERLRTLEREKNVLLGIQLRRLDIAGGVLEYRGAKRKRSDLPLLIEEVKAELDALQETLDAHEKRCRAVHLAIAQSRDPAWASYLRGLARMLHYAEHRFHDLADANGAYHNTFAIVTADGRVSAAERKRLIASANDLYETLRDIHAEGPEVLLNDGLSASAEIPHWQNELAELKLPAPHDQNLHQWVEVLDSWVRPTLGSLFVLKEAALDQLIAAEKIVADAFRKNEPLPPAPKTPGTPGKYAGFTRGSERPRQLTLDWWDRFIVADGLVPTVVRFVVALAIVGGVLFAAGLGRDTDLYVVNGLARPVVLTLGKHRSSLHAGQHAKISLEPGDIRVAAVTNEGEEIESFTEHLRDGGSYVYNIANATALIHSRLHYGNNSLSTENSLGAARWLEHDSNFMFDEPPRSITSKDKDPVRTWLYATVGANETANALPEKDKLKVAAAHFRWDPLNVEQLEEWLGVVSETQGKTILQERVARNPKDVWALRALQDAASNEEHATLCSEHKKNAEEAPNDPDWLYLSARCDRGANVAVYAKLAQRFPSHPWIAYAYAQGLAAQGDLRNAQEPMKVAADALGGSFVLSHARLLRVMFPLDTAPVKAIEDRSIRLKNFLALEKGQGNPPYAALGTGDLARATQKASTISESHRGSFIALVGASDGATKAQVNDALATKAAEGGYAEIARYALALREHATNVTPPAHARSVRFLNAAQTSVTEAEALLNGLSIEERGLAYTAGTILLGERTPAEWRRQAKALLFVGERPYLK